MLLNGNRIEEISIDTPAGVRYTTAVEEITESEASVRCGVRKDAGDDPDITNGILVCAEVRYLRGEGRRPEGPSNREDAEPSGTERPGRIEITGGEGVGRVTRPGLDQPVGAYAINSVPRRMIGQEVRAVMEETGYEGSLQVVVSVPAGAELAKKTFNPRLGIEGGISVIGTSGIVEPMSTRAILETIRVELRQQKAMGATVAVVSPGNYGLAFMKEQYHYDLDRAVKCANYIGDTIDMAAEEGFKKLLLCGHIGKLIKISGGYMNTHSKVVDQRMELMAEAAGNCGADRDTIQKILQSLTTEEAYGHLLAAGIAEACAARIMERIAFHLHSYAAGRLGTECIVYSNQYGLLGLTPGAESFLAEAMERGKGVDI